MKWAPLSGKSEQASLVVAALLLCGMATGASAQTTTAHHRVQRAAAAEDSIPYDLQLQASAVSTDSSSIETAPDTWNAKGYTLKDLVAQIFEMDARLVDLPEGVNADARYDLTLSFPVAVDQSTMQHILVSALEKKLGVTIRPESRDMDVYVLTAPNGPGSGLHAHVFEHHRSAVEKIAGSDSDASDEGGRITYTGRDCSGVSSGGITVDGGTMADFRRTLEPDLDRVMLDETHLTGSYDFKIGLYANQSQLFQLMQYSLGLVVTPAQRKVTVLAIRPTGSAPTTLEAKL